MSKGEAAPEKKIEISEADLHGSSRKLRPVLARGANSPGTEETADSRKPDLIETMLERGNLLRALQAVEGTPQGGPLSPLLSNILLDDLDQELEKRGHRFCRYADDCNIYVGSRRAGERVMRSLTRFLREKLKLTVNRLKSAVERPWKRKFLGFSLTAEKESRVRVAPQSVERFKDKLREKFREGRGRNLRTFLEGLKPWLRGWACYFSVAQTRGVFEELDQWIRRKLRCVEWRKWKGCPGQCLQ